MSNCRDWGAWHDHMPGPGSTPTLRVTGTREVATAGYSAEPREHEPQGITPKDLLLDLVLHEPYGDVSAEVLADVPASYSEETSIETALCP